MILIYDHVCSIQKNTQRLIAKFQDIFIISFCAYFTQRSEINLFVFDTSKK